VGIDVFDDQIYYSFCCDGLVAWDKDGYFATVMVSDG